jgi:anti-anti-sigma regulatory factor
MVLVTSNKEKQLLCFNYIGDVDPDQLARLEADVQALEAELKPGFRTLVDLSELDSMDLDCLKGLGRLMELADKNGVGLIVRVIPDPHKDIGFNILSIFHYVNRPQIITCKNMAEAGKHLGL